MKEIQENEVLFEKTDEYLVTVATASETLSQANAHNVTVLNENFSQEETYILILFVDQLMRLDYSPHYL